MKTHTIWRTAPISKTCEVQIGLRCAFPTYAAYPAWVGGWMALCHAHALKHPQATKIATLLERGERMKE